MGRSYVVQMRVTPQEWDVLDQIANSRRITVEDLLREHLGYGPLVGAMAVDQVRHLRAVPDEPAA